MKRAFTFSELLATIAIISVLASILFPVVSQAKSLKGSDYSISNSHKKLVAASIYSSNYDRVAITLPDWGNPGQSVHFSEADPPSPRASKTDVLKKKSGPKLCLVDCEGDVLDTLFTIYSTGVQYDQLWDCRPINKWRQDCVQEWVYINGNYVTGISCGAPACGPNNAYPTSTCTPP